MRVVSQLHRCAFLRRQHRLRTDLFGSCAASILWRCVPCAGRGDHGCWVLSCAACSAASIRDIE